MKNTLRCLLAALSMTGLSAHAAITYFQTDGSPYQTPALTGFSTTGDEMAGMQVTVTFTDGSTETATWATTGASAGAASNTGFSVSESGDTFNDNAWTLTDKSAFGIKSFSILAAPGNTTFDRTFGGNTGTPGSELGKDFVIGGGYSADVTYSDILNLTGSPAVGDEFELLTVAFTGGNFAGNSSQNFSQDTDSGQSSNGGVVITPTPDAGSASVLVGISLLGLAAFKRRLA